MIFLLDLGTPRDAMTFRAPEAEALYEGSAQKGFEVSSLDGNPFPRAQQAPMKPQRSPGHCEKVEAPDATGLETCGSRSKATQTN
jgi:hypothetical protein